MAINIQLNKQFKMKTNAHALQLCKKTTAGPESKNAGEVTYPSIAETTSFDSFFRSYVYHSLLNAVDENGHDITNFKDLMIEMNQVLDQIKEMFNFSGLTAGKTHKQCVEKLEQLHPEDKQAGTKSETPPEIFKNLKKRRKR